MTEFEAPPPPSATLQMDDNADAGHLNGNGLRLHFISIKNRKNWRSTVWHFAALRGSPLCFLKDLKNTLFLFLKLFLKEDNSSSLFAAASSLRLSVPFRGFVKFSLSKKLLFCPQKGKTFSLTSLFYVFIEIFFEETKVIKSVTCHQALFWHRRHGENWRRGRWDWNLRHFCCNFEMKKLWISVIFFSKNLKMHLRMMRFW